MQFVGEKRPQSMSWINPRGWISHETTVSAVSLYDASTRAYHSHSFAPVGIANQLNTSYWTCAAGPDPVPPSQSPSSSSTSTSSATTPPHSKTKSSLIGPIVGAVVGGLLLCLLLAFFWYRRRQSKQRLLRIDAWKSETQSSQEPAPLLHRRALSEQSQITTTSNHSHALADAGESSPEMRSAGVVPQSKFGHIQQRLDTPVPPPPSATESSLVLTPPTHATPLPVSRKTTYVPVASPLSFPASSTFVSSTTSLSQDLPVTPPTMPPPSLPAVSFVTSPTRSIRRLKSRHSNPSLRRGRVDSIPRTPDSPPVSADDVEQRLLELRNEADRGLAEIRAQRTGSGEGEMPPPYNV